MATAAVTLPDETEHITSIIYDIREALGISTIGTASTISNTHTRRTVATLEMMEREQLIALREISRKAQSNSMNERVADEYGDYVPAAKPFVGEDCSFIRDLLYGNEITELLPLAPVVHLMPANLRFVQARHILRQVANEMLDVSTPELIAAHLNVGRVTSRFGKYDAMMMLITSAHPDKYETIIDVFNQKKRVPTNREVITHYGVSPIMYDGVL